MERASGVLTQLRACRLQHLTALHQQVKAKVQGLLATLADGEDAVHLAIASGCVKVRSRTACRSCTRASPDTQPTCRHRPQVRLRRLTRFTRHQVRH
jgi:hypothetical protein